MLDQQHVCDARRGSGVQIAELVDLLVVDAAGWLVKQQSWLGGECARKLDPLLGAERKAGRQLWRVREIEIVETRGPSGSRPRRGEPGELQRREMMSLECAHGCRRGHCRVPTDCGTARRSGRCGRCRSRRCGAAAASGCCALQQDIAGVRRRGAEQLKSVVLPAPFGPIRPRIAPLCMSNDTRSSAMMPPNTTLTSRTASRGAFPCASWACVISSRLRARRRAGITGRIFSPSW